MNKSLTIATKGAIYFMGIALLVVCTVLLPELAREEVVSNPGSEPMTYPFLLGAWVLSLPIFAALYQTHKLVGFIGKKNAFSDKSVKALQHIKTCAMLFILLIIIGATAVIVTGKIIDPNEDVTSVITLGFIFTFVSIIVATFIAVLQRLLEDAITIKSENDLTV